MILPVSRYNAFMPDKSDSDSDDGRARFSGLAAVIAFSALAQTAQLGVLPVLLTLVLQSRGAEPSHIGLFAAAPWVMILLISRAVPKIIHRLGLVGAGVASVAVSVAAVVGMIFAEDFWLLFMLNLAAGFGLILRWIVCDVWIVHIADKTGRGRAIGAHETLMGLGIAVGPLLLAASGDIGAPSFLICAALMLAGLPLLAAARSWNAHPGASSGGIAFFPLFAILPTAIAGAFVCGFAETASISLLPAYAAALGMTIPAAALLVGAFGAGNTILQIPLGWLADAIGCARTQIIAAVIALAGALILPATFGIGALPWIVLFVWGGAAGGMNTLAVMEAGEKIGPQRIGAAMTSIAAVYTVGGIFGPSLSGAAMEFLPPHGLMFAMAASAAAFLLVVVARR